jgi:predicted ATPase
MKLTFENLGPIKKGEVDLNKKLTIICGPNNSGKTYLMYALYGVYDRHGANKTTNLLKINEVEDIFSKYKNKIEITSDYIKFNIEIFFVDELKNKYILSTNNRITQWIENSLDSNLEKNSFSISIDNVNILDILANRKKIAQYVESYKHDVILTYRKLITSITFIDSEITINIDKELNYSKNTLSLDLFSDIFNDIFLILFIDSISPQSIHGALTYFTSERNGIAIYNEDINFSQKNKRDRFLKDLPTNNNSITFIDDARYYFKEMSTNQSLYNYFSKYILIGGDVQTNEYGAIIYKTAEGQELELEKSSSGIKSNAWLGIWYKHRLTDKYQRHLFIDEPELSLHPDNHIYMARLIAKSINAGIKVTIATHSDYIFRELNTLVMLSQINNEDKRNELMERYGYSIDELLYPEDLGVYYLDNSFITSISVTEQGFSIPSIDKVINDQNVRSGDIFSTLEAQLYHEDESAE